MRGAVFHHWASSWYCSVLIELSNTANCGGCMGMVHVRVLGILYQKRVRPAGWTNYSVSFLSQ